MDLLLHLVKRHEIDLADIPIAELTDHYLAHLKLIETLDVEAAGEFLVTAAMLLEIKSQVMVPRVAEAQRKLAEDEVEDDEQSPDTSDDEAETSGGGGGGDPRRELVEQLLEYKRFRDAAQGLDERRESWSARAEAAAKRPSKVQADDDEDSAGQRDLDLEDVNVMDLCEAFGRMLDSIGQRPGHEVTYDDTPLSLHADDIRDRLGRESDKALSLAKVFEGRSGRSEMIGLFLAVLELVRQRWVKVEVDGGLRRGDPSGLRLVLADGPPDPADGEAGDAGPPDGEAATKWLDPETGEPQYDWPDPAAKQAALRRADLRRRRARGEATAEDDEDAFDASGVDPEQMSDDDLMRD
jgi:segregation and condensation protein A